jgi:REP element-mobilizing transposase RayT
MARGIDGRAVFNTVHERDDLVRRLSELVPETGTDVYAWVVMPNHLHLLTRTGSTPLSTFMHRLLTGFSVRYNLIRDRKGHVFQGRFKSILVEDGPYFHRLLRYIHLNPLKAGLVKSIEALSRYRWCGHGALVGTSSIGWQETGSILRWFSSIDPDAISCYLKYLDADSDEMEEQVLTEGSFILGKNGISRSSESLERDSWSCCCRVLGSREFELEPVRKIFTS